MSARPSFKTYNHLRELISAVSRDNVQPQAILAAEALGFGLLLSPEMIDEAIVALNGNESLRLAKLQVYVGLHSGGVARTVRQSTPLIQFFLTTAACKLCYTSEEIGTVMYEMIAASGLLLKYAVAASQLARLVDCLSAHAETIVPVNLMHDVAVAINTILANERIYRRIGEKNLAKLLVSIFEHLRDETVDTVTLIGSIGGVWLATLFLWLLPEKTSLYVENELVIGNGHTKLCIHLERIQPVLDMPRPWKVQIWKLQKEIQSLILEKEEEGQGLGLVVFPLRQTRLFIQTTHFVATDLAMGTEDRSQDTDVIGELAGALIRLITAKGRIRDKRSCCEYSDPKDKPRCGVAPIKHILSSDWLMEHEEMILQYGWDKRVLTGQNSMFSSLEHSFENRDKSETWDVKKTWAIIMKISAHLILNRLKKKKQLSEPESHVYSQGAYEVATDAILTATCKFVSGDRRFSYLSGSQDWLDAPLIASFLSRDGLDVETYHNQTLKYLFPGSLVNASDLVVSLDGFVAGYAPLWNLSTQQSEVFQLRVCAGHIRMDEFAYDSIREMQLPSPGFYSSLEPLELKDSAGFQPIQPRREPGVTQLENAISVSGTRLELRTTLTTRSPAGEETKRRVSWAQSLHALAVAIYIGRETELSSMQSTIVAQRLYNEGLEAYWAPALYSTTLSANMRKLVLRTFNNEELRFFAAGIMAVSPNGSLKCWKLIVRHGAPVLACIYAAEKKGLLWTIIC